MLKIFWLSLFLNHIVCDDLVDYYENLINDNIADAIQYELPKDASEFRPESPEIHELEEVYDFIIVGAGGAGSILSNRLSTNCHKKWKVLTLEAGDYENNFTDITALNMYLRQSKYNWGYYTVPQTTMCQAMVNKQCPHALPKAVGGRTVLYSVVYDRGNKKDFNGWANSSLHPRWNYLNMLKYFKKSENATGIGGSPFYRGFKGPMHTQYAKYTTPMLEVFIEGNEKLGQKYVDTNGEAQEGVGRVQFNIDGCIRDTVAKAFIYPALKNNRLNLIHKSYVTKIIIENRRAKGVEFTNGGKIYRAYAKKEVLLTGGGVASAALLMRSGIGPRKDLEVLGIPLIADLPVGEFYQDHAIYQGLTVKTNISEDTKPMRKLIKEFLDGYGAYCLPSFEAHSYFTTKFARDENYPDMELLLLPMKENKVGLKTTGYSMETLSALRKDSESMGKEYLFLIISQQAKSYGNVKLNSSDPFEYPLINPNSFSDPEDHDINAMVEYVRITMKLLETEPFRKVNATLKRIELEACKEFEYFSDDHIKCTVRHLSNTAYFPVGTCKMGPKFDKTAVVDNRCFVHKVKGLRVVDTSIFPFTFSGHAGASAFALAEQVSEMIFDMY